MLSELLRKYKSVDISQMRPKAFLSETEKAYRLSIEAINQNHGWVHVAACPICGSGKKEFELEKLGVELVRCQECSTRYGSKIPASPDDIYNIPDYQVYLMDQEEEENHFRYRRDRFGTERVQILEKYCGDLTNQRILDIGCGNGFFLAAAKEKCHHCFGTEYSHHLRKATAEKLGLTIFDANLESLEKHSFDIVTLFDVIEHISKPIEFFNLIDRIVKPGGYIFIFTPNFDSFSIHVMREYSPIIAPFGHVVLYTERSLRRLASQYAYDVVYFETQGLDIYNIMAMQEYLQGQKDPFLVKWVNELQSMINSSNCGDYARVMFKKPQLLS